MIWEHPVSMMQVVKEKISPKSVHVDNGREFTSKLLGQRVNLIGMEPDFIRLGKPADNALTEAFNGRSRKELLSKSRFLSMKDAGERAEAPRQHYDHTRPNRALGNLSTLEIGRYFYMTIARKGSCSPAIRRNLPQSRENSKSA